MEEGVRGRLRIMAEPAMVASQTLAEPAKSLNDILPGRIGKCLHSEDALDQRRSGCGWILGGLRSGQNETSSVLRKYRGKESDRMSGEFPLVLAQGEETEDRVRACEDRYGYD